jgi:hypothetical protein
MHFIPITYFLLLAEIVQPFKITPGNFTASTRNDTNPENASLDNAVVRKDVEKSFVSELIPIFFCRTQH